MTTGPKTGSSGEAVTRRSTKTLEPDGFANEIFVAALYQQFVEIHGNHTSGRRSGGQFGSRRIFRRISPQMAPTTFTGRFFRRGWRSLGGYYDEDGFRPLRRLSLRFFSAAAGERGPTGMEG